MRQRAKGGRAHVGPLTNGRAEHVAAPGTDDASARSRRRWLPRDVSQALPIYNEEGVIASRSKAGFLIFLPRTVSTSQHLCATAALWEVWIASRNDVSDWNANWTIDVSEFDDLPISLIAVISAIEADLIQSGRSLQVVGCSPPLSMGSATQR